MEFADGDAALSRCRRDVRIILPSNDRTLSESALVMIPSGRAAQGTMMRGRGGFPVWPALAFHEPPGNFPAARALA